MLSIGALPIERRHPEGARSNLAPVRFVSCAAISQAFRLVFDLELRAHLTLLPMPEEQALDQPRH